MQLVALIVLACKLADPSACQEYRILFESAGSLRSCMMQAMPYLATWAGAHPDERVARWRCAWPDQEGDRI